MNDKLCNVCNTPNDLPKLIEDMRLLIDAMQDNLTALQNIMVMLDANPAASEPEPAKGWSVADIIEEENKYVEELYDKARPITISKQTIEEMVQRALQRTDRALHQKTIHEESYATVGDVLRVENWSATDIFNHGSDLVKESHQQCKAKRESCKDAPIEVPSTFDAMGMLVRADKWDVIDSFIAGKKLVDNYLTISPTFITQYHETINHLIVHHLEQAGLNLDGTPIDAPGQPTTQCDDTSSGYKPNSMITLLAGRQQPAQAPNDTVPVRSQGKWARLDNDKAECLLPILITVNGKQISRIYVDPEMDSPDILQAALDDKSVKDWLTFFDESSLDINIKGDVDTGSVRTAMVVCIIAKPADWDYSR